jgi:hypothetical protein
MKDTDVTKCTLADHLTDSIPNCPIFDNKNEGKSEFVVMAHNAGSQRYKQFIRVRLPSNRFKAQLWSKTESKFVDTESDVIE